MEFYDERCQTTGRGVSHNWFTVTLDSQPRMANAGTTTMTIELSKEDKQTAIESLQKYFEVNLDEPLGNLAAGALLGFILEEIGPSIYNKGVADAQERMQVRLSELDYEVHADEFQYWRKAERQPKGRK